MLRKFRFFFAYLHKPPWDTGISPPELMDFIETHPPGKALDLGCGTGTNAITLAKHGWNVIGIDYARIAIHNAKKKAKQEGLDIDFHLADVTRLKSVNGPFDLILDIGCYPSLPPEKRNEYIVRIEELLSEAGTFLIYLFYKEEPGGDRPGVTSSDIEFLTQRLQVVQQTDGTERGLRPSSWFILQKNNRK